MPITLDVTDINTCESTTGLSRGTSNIPTSGEGSIQVGDATPQQGSNMIEFGNEGGATGVLTVIATATSYNSRTQDTSVWFLNPVVNNSGDELVDTGDDAVQLGLGNGTVVGYFNQGGRGTIPGGWSLLRACGDATPDETTGGTFTTTVAEAITEVIVRVKCSANNDTKNDGKFGVDWFKRHTTITVAGDNTGTPYTMDDIEAEDQDTGTGTSGSGSGRWGLVEKSDVFYKLGAGLTFTNDGATDGDFADENKYLLFDQLGASSDYDVTVTNNATARFGLKDAVPTPNVYAVNGCTLRAGLGRPAMTVQSGGVLQLYGSRIRGWGTINLGSGGTSAIDLINNDFLDNTAVEFRSTGLTADRLRLHFLDGSEAPVGGVYNVPSDMRNIEVFQATNGLRFEVSMTITNYYSGDNTYDFVVQEGDTVTTVDSEFADPPTILRVL